MLSPNDISPKGKAASIWSFDSGYGSNTIEDEEPLDVSVREFIVSTRRAASDTPQLHPQPSLSTEAKSAQPSVGLGINGLGLGGFWNVHVRDKLRLKRSESPVDPVITKVNVFTARDTPTSTLPLPNFADSAETCITCQLWDLTNPGQGLKCDGCKSKDFVRPEVLHLFGNEPKGKIAVPRLEIPRTTSFRLPSRLNTARCSACELARKIDPHTSAACPSCAPNTDLLSPVSPSTVRRSCARRHTKLPPHALRQLRAWLEAHRDHPYPSPDDKRALAQECGLTEKQVTTWFTNTRARKLPMPNEGSHGSSGDEGAYESDFSNIGGTPSYTTSPAFRYNTPSSNPFDTPLQGPSTSEHPQLALQTSRRGKKKDYRRMNTNSPVDDSPIHKTPSTPSPYALSTQQEMWQCTFCKLPLAPKSWRRHEETQHRPKRQWTCLATGPRLTVASRSGTSSICAFCQLKDPSEDHLLNSHRIMECSKKSEVDRTFGRPDHLRQHVKNFHKTLLLDMVRDRWRKKSTGEDVSEHFSCGFCQEELNNWDARETHIANHFKDGLTMANWQEQARCDTPFTDDDRMRTLRVDHASKLTRLVNSIASQSIVKLEEAIAPVNNALDAFDPISTSTSFQNVATISALPEFGNDVDFGNYLPVNFTDPFTVASSSAMGDLGALYPMLGNDYGYGIYEGGESMAMPYNEMLDEYGNSVDTQDIWGQQQP
jgi:hypothetical protein